MQVQMLTPAAISVSNGAGAAVLSKPPGVFAIIGGVLRTHGVRGLWLGHSGTLIRETGGSAAWFTTKEAVASTLIARRMRDDPLQSSAPLAWESAVAGATAGAAYNLALFPADTVKSTVQTAEELRPSAPGVPRPTYFGTAREMWRHGGIRGLYAGCGITIARSIPSSAVVFVLYDGLKNYFS
jgi:mitochondrial ornithine carrier protein